MDWSEIFSASRVPSLEDIREYLGEAKSIWYELTSFIEEAYKVKPKRVYFIMAFYRVGDILQS